ncbi:hypothetical protein MNV84_01041 [Leishmania braziliensis]|nr:hypothetical protein MNV84_01041 [Leishmania braziliensis]
MLSMFKDKKGFSVLFRGEGGARQSGRVTDTSVCRHSDIQLPGTAARPDGSGVAQHQCQRCSKRFCALESDDDTGVVCRCHRCGYPTCLQCREPATGTPPWVCCVCNGFKSIMWLLEKTRAGPMLVTRIVDYCDPRGQRLMRSMFRFTLQQYQAVTPRPSLKLAGRPSDIPASSGTQSSSRPASQTPPPRLTSGARTSSRLSGERSGARLTQVPPSFSNVRRPLPYTHPKHASLLRSVRRSDSGAAFALDAGAIGGAEGSAKENSPAEEDIVRGSETLRRLEEAVGVVEYSPESKWWAPGEVSEEAGGNAELSSSLPDGNERFAQPDDRCAAVADIYHARTPRALACGATLRGDAVEAETLSPHARPSGCATFQREPLQPQLASTSDPTTQTMCGSAVMRVAVAPAPESSSMRITPLSQPCRLGHSLSPASSVSGRSVSPAPRFPTFGQFLDDHAGFTAAQTHLPRESNVLVTVSPETEEESEESGGVIELGGGRRGDHLVATSGNAKVGLHTPRDTELRTPPSADGGGSSGLRSGRRTSGLCDFTPTRALDMSSARGTLQHRSSSCRRTTRGSLGEMHAPHLYDNSSSKASMAGNPRRSGQVHDSPYAYTLPKQFGSHLKSAGSMYGQLRRQQPPLPTRTAGHTLGSDSRQRLGRQNSRTTTPLQRTTSHRNELQRTPSRSGALARTNSFFAPLKRTASSHVYAPSFARTNSSTTRALACTPSHRAHRIGAVSGCRGLQRTESAKIAVSGLNHGATARAAQQGTAASQPTQFGYRTPTAAGASSMCSSPLKRTLSSWSPLKRTASHMCLRVGGAAPFGRKQSASCFTRSATTNNGFVGTRSVPALGGGAPLRRTPSAFTRTATGTHLFHYSHGRVYERARYTPGLSPLSPSAAVRGSGYGEPRGYHRVAAASPVRRVPTATRTSTPTMGRRRLPTPAALSRTPTGTRNFERLQSSARREPAGGSGRKAGRTVDPAPTLVGVTRRKALGSSLRHTPSASGADGTAVATPLQPRRFIIASVSTAATAAAVNGGGSHCGPRPVLSSGASIPKSRSSRGSLSSGDAAGPSSHTSSVPTAAAPIEEQKAADVEPRSGRANTQRRRPLGGAIIVKEKEPLRVATLSRRETSGSATTTPRPSIGIAAPRTPFAR